MTSPIRVFDADKHQNYHSCMSSEIRCLRILSSLCTFDWQVADALPLCQVMVPLSPKAHWFFDNVCRFSFSVLLRSYDDLTTHNMTSICPSQQTLAKTRIVGTDLLGFTHHFVYIWSALDSDHLVLRRWYMLIMLITDGEWFSNLPLLILHFTFRWWFISILITTVNIIFVLMTIACDRATFWFSFLIWVFACYHGDDMDANICNLQQVNAPKSYMPL